MMTMEYPISHHKYACSTMSSETLSGSCGSRNNRVRTIRLVKRHSGNVPIGVGGKHGATLGFSIRGGHEHGTGFFVSHVENGSEAHAQGLKVGDQIIRINGFTIEDAIHKEVLQLISNHTHLTLKVRSVGMIPVKDKKTDILSWQIITDTNSCSSRSSPQFIEKNRDVRIQIMVAPRSKLGCGICKGPEWKPGIFVQFTKEGGIAREAGLRPGDQIVQCNNVDFSDIPFNEAVNLMKTSRQLDLLIRKAAASELFPGESSGYNSSASSVTEDQSSSWGDPKRLSIVKEENQHTEERLNQRSFTNSWNLPDWEEEPTEKSVYKPTIINVTESGTTIKNNGIEYASNKLEQNASHLEDHKMPERTDSKVVVEVHRSDEDDSPCGVNGLAKSSSSSSLASKASLTSAASSSLSSAISMELKRRSEKKATKPPEDTSIDEQLQKKKLLRGLSSDQQFQHTKLMNEFKQAHQKMFKTSSLDCTKSNSALGKDTLERLAHKELSQKLSDRLLNLASNENNRPQEVSSPPPPPPPPPSQILPSPTIQSPSVNSSTPPAPKIKPKAPPVPIKRSVLSCYQPPPCPTPDYDTLSLSSTSSTIKPAHVHESVEMDSLESFKMHNPNHVTPKPPGTYFQKRDLCSKLSNGSVASSAGKERPKSVNISIGEYAVVRSPPRKLDFLKNGTLGRKSVGNSPGNLAYELTQTLNKSNLRKRTESMDDLLNTPEIRAQSNGTVRISVSNLAKEFAKSTSDLTEDYEVTSKTGNRIMININQEKMNGVERMSNNTYG
ncbi:harmonin [Diabrotica virgifera virgifera]|uniref:Harmonin isoform X1 n=1 Tax=Diabrotica virgifera virgifera TaxID=50390 RepID=A0A6P7FEB7_DIAVI|nr:harmonin [Diabrotica virgifera virgifera]